MSGVDVDPVIHAPVRLRITSVLATLDPDDTLSFSRLRRELDLTSGNLISHLRKLEEAGYVESTKTGAGRDTATEIGLTKAGRQAFADYRVALVQLLDGAALGEA